jgi:hypothetical protein
MMTTEGRSPSTVELRLPAQGTASAGKMTLLGLENIKLRLGERWEKVSGSVHRFYEAALEKRMGPGDAFYKVGEMSYVAVFPNLSAAEAQVKCVAVAEEVCRRMFGDDTGEVSVRSVVGEIDSKLVLEDVDIAATIQQCLELNGMETIVSEDGRTLPKPSILPDLPAKGEKQLSVAFGPGARAVPLTEKELSFVYRPIWDAARQVVLMYLCQPVPPRGQYHGLCSAPNHDDDRFALDFLLLRQAARRIGNLRQAGVRLRVACPIHFSTIARSRQWTDYVRMLEKMPPAVVRDLAFLVLGIDRGVPNARLSQELPKLAARSKCTFVAIDAREPAIARFTRTGVQAVGLELLPPDGTDRNLIEQVTNFALEASAQGLEAFVLGVHTTSTAVGALAAGIRYVEGKPVWPAVVEPRHAFVHAMEDLYRDAVAI